MKNTRHIHPIIPERSSRDIKKISFLRIWIQARKIFSKFERTLFRIDERKLDHEATLQNLPLLHHQFSGRLFLHFRLLKS